MELNLGLGLNRGAFDELKAVPPPDFGDLEGWWDFSDSGNIILNGSNVAEATDKSGNGNDLVQANANFQPPLDLASVNGLDSAKADGIVDQLSFAPNLNPGTNNTFFLVCEVEPTANSAYILSGNAPGGGPAILSKFNPGDGVKALEWFFVLRATFSALGTGVHVLAVTQDDSASPQTRGYLDGFQVFSGDSSSWDPYVFTQIMGTGGSGAYSGNFCEMAFYLATRSPSEIGSLSEYGKVKWGTP